MICSFNLKNADCIIVLVLLPKPISLASVIASIIYNLAFFNANCFLNELGMNSNNSSSLLSVFNKKRPPSFNEDNISYFST